MRFLLRHVFGDSYLRRVGYRLRIENIVLFYRENANRAGRANCQQTKLFHSNRPCVSFERLFLLVFAKNRVLN